MSSIDYDIANQTTLEPQTLISKTADGDRAVKMSRDGMLIEYDILTTKKTFEVGQNGFYWTDGVTPYTTSLSRIAAVQQALAAVELPPNSTTLKLNDTILLDAGNQETLTINEKSIVGANDDGTGIVTGMTLKNDFGGQQYLGFGSSVPFGYSNNLLVQLHSGGSTCGISHFDSYPTPSDLTISTDQNLALSSSKNLTLAADNIDLSSTGRLIVPSLASTNYMDYNTGKLTIVNDSVAGSTNPLLVLQNNNNTAGATTFETYKNDLPTSTGGDVIASWSATCNTNVGKTETSRVNHIAYGVGASNNDGGISLACKVNSTISTFLTCNGGVGSGEIQVFKTITTTSPNNLQLACPTAGGAIALTSASNINLEATGDNLTMTAGSAVLIETTGTGASIEFKPESSAGDLVFTGANIESSSSGANSGQHLRIKLNGTYYKIRLENDV